MLTSTTSCFARVGGLGARSFQLQTTTAVPRAACPYSSWASLAQRQFAAQMSRRIASKTTAASATAVSKSVFASSIVRRQASTAAAAAPSSAAPNLDWNSFFTLRKTRRRIQLISSICTTIVGGGAGALLLVNQDLDWLLGKIPMDPFFSLGLITLSFAGLGWLAGPSVGNAIFYTFKSGVKSPMAVKEAEFFARIKKNRVDPTSSSVQNPGETSIRIWQTSGFSY